jgi:diguanylate cyclase (GGDEF)-like protein
VLAGTRRMALLICDIDRFKSINDAFGHSAGDTVLRTVAAALCADVGKSGQVYRYSGDEFVVLLRDADRATAVHMAARLTDRIADLSVPVTAVDGWEYLVSGLSISIGWTAELGPHREPHELILAADAALLAAKRKSRKTPLPSMRAAW